MSRPSKEEQEELLRPFRRYHRVLPTIIACDMVYTTCRVELQQKQNLKGIFFIEFTPGQIINLMLVL